ncbi:hypothetical protein FQN55_005596 [Onygenales sp. PD_40]|nr:hypothetical protein FQN55_005596 [Onygenales sp. PD_40]
MRLKEKFYVLGLLAACGILYFFWSLHYSGYTSSTGTSPAAAKPNGYTYRLVVFGDSWSDGKNIQDTRRGKVWTEWLCSKFSCFHENMAESSSSAGAVVDNDELERIPNAKWSGSPLADLKTQMRRWMLKEEKATAGFTKEEIERRQKYTIFSVSFGVWDIWRLLGQDLAAAKLSAQRSVATIFEELSVLGFKWTAGEMKVVLMAAVDVTFLPAFKLNNETHRDAVPLVDEWNKQLKEHAKAWKNGPIFFLDTNSFLLDQLRERQLWVAGYIDTKDFGKDGMDWDNVDSACAVVSKKWLLGKQEVCRVPEKYLFW